MFRKLLLVFILFPVVGFSQSEEMKAAMQKAFLAAKRMDEALIKREYYTFAQFSHPNIVEQVEGGRPGLAMLVKKQLDNMDEQNNVLTAVWPGQPLGIIDTAGELQCTIPQYMERRLPNGKLKTETILVGISPDKGNKWYFIDVANTGGIDGLRKLFPTLSSKLYAPPTPEPQFTPDE